jgi:hypothetical protein
LRKINLLSPIRSTVPLRLRPWPLRRIFPLCPCTTIADSQKNNLKCGVAGLHLGLGAAGDPSESGWPGMRSQEYSPTTISVWDQHLESGREEDCRYRARATERPLILSVTGSSGTRGGAESPRADGGSPGRECDARSWMARPQSQSHTSHTSTQTHMMLVNE